MKKLIKLFSVLAIAALCFTACNDDEDGKSFYEGYGTVMGSMSKYFMLDGLNEPAIPVNFNLSEYDNETRFMFYYSVVSDADASSTSSYKKIQIEDNLIWKMPVQNAQVTDLTINDTLGNDPFYNIDGYWVSGNFLTIVSQFYGHQRQSLYLVNDSKTGQVTVTGTDTVAIQLRRKNIDGSDYPTDRRGTICFKLDELRPLQHPSDSVVLKMTYPVSMYPGSETEPEIKTVHVTHKW